MVSPINWVITGFDARSLGTYMELLIKTDVMVYLECFWTYDDPDVQLIPRYQRGVRTWCLVKKRIPDWHRAFQSEWADSIYHTFRLPIDFVWRKHYLRFEGTFLGTPTISNSPIFQRTKRIYWEPWEGSIGLYHPWFTWLHTPNSFHAIENHQLLISLAGRWAGDQEEIALILSNNPAIPEYMILPRFMDTTNTLPFTGHWFMAFIRFSIAGPGYGMELTCYIANPNPIVFPNNQPWSRSIFIGTGRTLTSLRLQLSAWLNYKGLPPNPELAHISRIYINANNQPWPHPHPSALRQDYLDLLNELPD